MNNARKLTLLEKKIEHAIADKVMMSNAGEYHGAVEIGRKIDRWMEQLRNLNSSPDQREE